MACPEEIRSALDELPGIEINTFNEKTRQFSLSFDSHKLNKIEIITHISNTKFEVINVKAIN